MTLPEPDFSNIVKNTPLVSIDLIISDPSGSIMMGWRNNEPAKDTWFVPGGRIRKNEKIADAFDRIICAETGLVMPFQDARFCGVFEHFYSVNCFEDPSFGTHYCVLAYLLRFDHRPSTRIDSQHSKFDWITRSSMRVHPYSRAYFDVIHGDRD
jgi:colanic acid biosynthesis protein WcaH